VSFDVNRVIAGNLRFVNGRSPGGLGCTNIGAYKGIIGAGVLGSHVLGFAEEGDVDVL
jgi:hypothetical protein